MIPETNEPEEIDPAEPYYDAINEHNKELKQIWTELSSMGSQLVYMLKLLEGGKEHDRTNR